MSEKKYQHLSRREETAIENWENEGGSPGAVPHYHEDFGFQYGKRIEIDRTWTVYHVFTGIPVSSGDGALVGLSNAEASAMIASFNIGKEERRKSTIKRLRIRGPSISPWDFRRWL